MMTRAQAIRRALTITVVGGGLLFYLLVNISPLLPDGDFNRPAIFSFFLGLFLFTSGIGVLIANVLHQRWSVLAGVTRNKRRQPPVHVAIRQGILLGLTVSALAMLAFLQATDIAFVIVIFVLVGLFEAFAQSRDR